MNRSPNLRVAQPTGDCGWPVRPTALNLKLATTVVTTTAARPAPHRLLHLDWLSKGRRQFGAKWLNPQRPPLYDGAMLVPPQVSELDVL